MDNSELITKLKKAKSNLEKAEKQINYAIEKLSDSIMIDDVYFKKTEFDGIQSKINNEIYRINNKMIPKLNNIK